MKGDAVSGLAVSGLHKAFGAHPVLTGVDLEVPAGSLTAILGPSGSGKTTLLRLLAGFERADSGTISIGETVVDGPGAYLAPERRRIGYVPQEGSLFPHLTVAAQRRLRPPGAGPARAAGSPPCWTWSAWAGWASGTPTSCPAASSSGWRWPGPWPSSRPWCCSTSRSPRWTPTCGPASAPRSPGSSAGPAPQRCWSPTTRTRRCRPPTGSRPCATGRSRSTPTPEDLYARPADAELARFVGEANLLEGVLAGGMVKTLLGNLPVDSAAAGEAGQVTVLIRPEQIDLEASADGVTGQVLSYGYHGHDAVVYVQPDQDADSRPIVVRILGGQQLPVGSPVTLRARGPVFTWPRD